MTTVRYARVKSTITDENSDDNVNQLETIDSEEEDEEDVLPGTPVKRHADPNVTIKNSVERRSLIRTVFWIGLLILCYFILSIGLTFYQRWLLKVIDKTQRDEKLFFHIFLCFPGRKTLNQEFFELEMILRIFSDEKYL